MAALAETNFLAVTAQKPTAVQQAVVMHFTGEHDTNLVVNKGTRIEIHKASPEGLLPLLDVPINGRIATMQRLTLQKEQTDSILLTTEKHKVCILSYDPGKNTIITRVTGDIHDAMGRESDVGQIMLVDPQQRCLAVYLYDGIVKVLPFVDDESGLLEKEAYNVRIEELRVVDMCFLHGCARPTLAVLYEDTHQEQPLHHIKTYELVLRSKDIQEGDVLQENLDVCTSHLISVAAPVGGVIVVGSQSITYFAQASHAGAVQNDVVCAQSNTANTIMAVSSIPGIQTEEGISRLKWLVGDERGTLWLMQLQVSTAVDSQALRHLAETDRLAPDCEPSAIELVRLGETSVASALAYIDNGFAFVGSKFGDSQLIRIRGDAKDGQFIDVIDTYTQIGPILDMCVMDPEKSGQGQVITCSGAWKDGSLRVVRNGVGIHEQACLDLRGITGLYSLVSCPHTDSHVDYVVLSFTNETRVFAISNEIEDLHIPQDQHKLKTTEPTLFCTNVKCDESLFILQVTPSSVLLLSPQLDVVSELNVSMFVPLLSTRKGIQSIKIMHAAFTQGQSWVVLSVSGGAVVFVQIEGGILSFKKVLLFNQDISCIGAASVCGEEWVCVGTWSDLCVRNFLIKSALSAPSETIEGVPVTMYSPERFPTHVFRPSTDSVSQADSGVVQPVVADHSTTQQIPRALFLGLLKQGPRSLPVLLVSLGSGKIAGYVFNALNGSVGECQRMNLGTYPAALEAIHQTSINARGEVEAERVSVFAGSDRPAVIYLASSEQRKLSYSYVNLRNVNHVCSFSCSSYEDCLAYASPDALIVGTIDAIQKLHVRTIPLNGEMPRRIVHMPTRDRLCLITSNATMSYNEAEISTVRLLDPHSLEALDAYQLPPGEDALAVCVGLRFGGTQEQEPVEATEAYTPSASGAPSDQTYFVVGTAIINPREREPSAGRILVFTLDTAGNRLRLEGEKLVKGAVYTLKQMNGRIVAGINGTVHVFKITELVQEAEAARLDIVPECWQRGHTVVVSLDVAPTNKTDTNNIVVGDLMHGVSLLSHKANEPALDEAARDYNPTWVMAVGAVSDEVMIASEHRGNLFACMYHGSDAASEEDKARLEVVCAYNAGEIINVFQRGSLVLANSVAVVAAPEQQGEEMSVVGEHMTSDEEVSSLVSRCKPKMIYGSQEGSLGVIVSIPKAAYDLLADIQDAMRVVVRGVGGLSHADYRCFSNDQRTEKDKGIIDGDFIENIVNLQDEQVAAVCHELKHHQLAPSTLNRFVDELSRLH